MHTRTSSQEALYKEALKRVLGLEIVTESPRKSKIDCPFKIGDVVLMEHLELALSPVRKLNTLEIYMATGNYNATNHINSANILRRVYFNGIQLMAANEILDITNAKFGVKVIYKEE